MAQRRVAVHSPAIPAGLRVSTRYEVPRKKLNIMTEREIANALRAQRSTTQADVDRRAESHGAKVRYMEHDRHAPAAH